MKRRGNSELLLNDDGSIYHLKLRPEQVGDTVLLAGDPGRVSRISRFFDRLLYRIENREFITHTGLFGGKRITAMSTGIGTDNIDIVLNELDALVNIDFSTAQPKSSLRSLDIIRLGTSGALQPDLAPGSFVVSEFGLGFDSLIPFYAGARRVTEKAMANAFFRYMGKDSFPAYFVKGDSELIRRIGHDLPAGITATAPGFYGPQGRVVRLPVANPQWMEKLSSFRFREKRILNFEMETSALYALAKLLNHRCVTLCTIIANRVTGEFCRDYKKRVDEMIKILFERL